MAQSNGIRLNYLLVFIVALGGSWTYGFNVQIIGGVLGMQSFYDYFNLSITATSGAVGAIAGCFYGGGILGAILGGWLCDKAGRRRALFATCLIGIAGSILQGAAVNIAMILTGRALAGISSGSFQTIVPIYQSEISPAANRGRMVGTHGFLVVTAAAVAVWVGLGCSYSSIPQLQWRLALSLGVLSPLFLAPIIPWLPESPRWLIGTQRHQQAFAILKKLHRTPGDSDDNFAREEYFQICKQTELEKHQKQRFLVTLRSPSMQKRLFIGFLIQFLLQSSGVLVTLNYQVCQALNVVNYSLPPQVTLYEGLGITGQLAIALLGVYTTWCAILNFVNTLIVDRIGRVRLFLIGLSGSVFGIVGFTIMVALFSGTANKIGCGFGIFFVFLYTTFYASCLDVTSYIYCAEIFPNNRRTFGMAVSIVGFFAPALIYGQVAPTAFATIGWKFYLVFIIVPTCGLPIIWLYFPETRGCTLEEIGGLFGDELALNATQLSPEERANFSVHIEEAGMSNVSEFDDDVISKSSPLTVEKV